MAIFPDLDVELLQIENSRLQCALAEKDGEILYLEGQLDGFKRQLFGKKSERVVSDLDPQQLYFEGFEAQTSEPPKCPVSPHERSSPKKLGSDSIRLDPELPVETTVLDIPEQDKFCQETGAPLIRIGEEVTHKLARKPGSFYIRPSAPSMHILSTRKRGS